MFLVGRDYTLEKNKIKVEADHFKDILMEEFSDDDHIRKVIMGMSFYLISDGLKAKTEAFSSIFSIICPI